MPTLRVEVTKAQYERLEEQAEEKGLEEPEEAIVAIWWGRTQALDKYAERRKQSGAKFRPYAPLKLKGREKVKTDAIAQGIAPVPRTQLRKGPPRPKKAKMKKGSARPAVKTPALQAENAGSTPARSTPTLKPTPPKLRKKAVVHPKKVVKIDMLDGAGVALNKARQMAEEAAGPGNNYVESDVIAVLRANGRDLNGELIKPVKGA